MIDYESQFEKSPAAMATAQMQITSIFKRVYGWMSAGLLLSGVVAWWTAASGLYMRVLTRGGLTVCIIGELALVWVLSASAHKMSAFLASALFLLYSAVNGLTLSIVFIAYDLALVERAFFITGGMFAGLALWGTFTKENLSSIGHICGMALWGVIIASIVNIFVASSLMDWILSYAGVLVFTGLTMYDAQKIKELATGESQLDMLAIRRLSIIGALTLYLDFINLFLCILRILGGKSRD